jgi:hypothetical protein
MVREYNKSFRRVHAGTIPRLVEEVPQELHRGVAGVPEDGLRSRVSLRSFRPARASSAGVRLLAAAAGLLEGPPLD